MLFSVSCTALLNCSFKQVKKIVIISIVTSLNYYTCVVVFWLPWCRLCMLLYIATWYYASWQSEYNSTTYYTLKYTLLYLKVYSMFWWEGVQAVRKDNYHIALVPRELVLQSESACLHIVVLYEIVWWIIGWNSTVYN